MIRLLAISYFLLSLLAAPTFAGTELNKQPAKEATEHNHDHDKPDVKPDPIAMAEHLKIAPTDYVMGDKKAKVTIFEYASLSCPHCAEFEEKTLPRIYEKYIKTGKVNLVFRDFPLNAPALDASKLARCAAFEAKDKKDDVFYRFIKVLFSSQKSWALDRNPTEMIQKIGALGGFSKESFDKCLENKDIEKQILESRKNAADILKITSTPSFFVGMNKLDGTRAFEEFAGAIEAELKEK